MSSAGDSHSPRTLERTVPLGFGVAIAALIVVGILAYRSTQRFAAAATQRAASYVLRQHLSDLLAHMQDAETGQRGFLLTGERSYLEPFLGASKRVGDDLAILHQTAIQDSVQAGTLGRIDSLSREKLGELNWTLDLYHQGGLNAALPVVLSGQGKAAMDTLRAAIASIAAREEETTRHWNLLTTRTGTIALRAIPLTLLLATGFLLIAALLSRRQLAARRVAEIELQSSRRFLDSVIEHMPAMVFVKDARQLRFVSFNHAGEELLGYGREELIGKNDHDFFPEDEAQAFIQKDRDVLANGAMHEIAEEPIHTRERGVRILRTLKVPIPDASGHPEYLLGISEDITERKQSEATIAAATAEIHDLYERAPCGYATLDVEGRIRRINQTALDWLGQPAEALVGQPFAGRLTADSQVGWQKAFAAFRSGSRLRDLELELVWGNGSILPVCLDATAILNQAGEFQLARCTISDVRERKIAREALERANSELEDRVAERTMELEAANEELRQTVEELQAAEEELRQQNDELAEVTNAVRLNEHRIRTAVMHLPLILFNQDRELRFTWFSGPRPGSNQTAPIGLTDMDILSQSDAARLVQLKRRVLERGTGLRSEFNFSRDGTQFTYDVTLEPLRNLEGAVVGLTGAAIDVTAQKRSDEQLRSTHDQLQALVEASPQAIVSLDADGRVSSWYGGAERLFGWTRREVLGQRLDNVPSEKERESEELQQRALSGASFSEFETRRVRKDGATIDVSISAAPLHDPDGRVSGVVTVYSDITARRVAAESQRGREAAETATRAKSQFLANMSHELRTPLNAIIGFSELLEDETFGPLNQRQLKYVDNILTSGRHLLQLVNDILDLAKIEAGRLVLEATEFEVQPALEEVQRVVESLAMSKSLPVELHLAADLPALNTDRGKFKQILYNLLSNAIKFTPEGGRIQVMARAVDADGVPPQAAGRARGPGLVVSVADTGIGIGAEDLDRIFAEFEQIDASYVRQQQGTGLGLALTRRLVELQGGHIWVESEVGKGSTFTFMLPLISRPAPAEPSPSTTLAQAALEDPRPLILVVEDDKAASRLLTTYLTNNGYRVAVAETAAQALTMASRLRPVAITLDILLPDRHGLEVLAELRSRPDTGHIPVIVVSITETRELGFSLGATEWLVKPIVGDQFMEAINRVVAPTRDGRPASVLVVDDENATVEMVTDLLQSRGFRTLQAWSGEEGLRLAKSALPDAMVLDLMMPGMSGFEVVQRLREDAATSRIPVLIFSVKDLTPEERTELQGKVQRIVSKSGVEDLLQSLNSLEKVHRS